MSTGRGRAQWRWRCIEVQLVSACLVSACLSYTRLWLDYSTTQLRTNATSFQDDWIGFKLRRGGGSAAVHALQAAPFNL